MHNSTINGIILQFCRAGVQTGLHWAQVKPSERLRSSLEALGDDSLPSPFICRAACILWLLALSSSKLETSYLPDPFMSSQSFLTKLGRISLLLKSHVIRLGPPGWSRLFPQLRGLQLIPPVNSLLPGKVTCTGSGVRTWTSLGVTILPTGGGSGQWAVGGVLSFSGSLRSPWNASTAHLK